MSAQAVIRPDAVAALLERERARFTFAHPRSRALAEGAAAHWLGGAPMHWMRDWASPFPLFVSDGEGATLVDADDHVFDDFCLGDTPGMFGHAPVPVAKALAEQARRGATFMLPTEEAVEVGALLAARFGLPLWQTTLSASDANRGAIRWARAITGKRVIVIFDGCYHGMVEDCFVGLDADGRTRMDPGLVGQVQDYTTTTRVIPFNDLAALDAALAAGDVAAVLAEPAMTNLGMIAPAAGFHDALGAKTRAAGALLILDETHTLSTGPGGATKAWGLEPDILVVGKAIAGGFPAAVWGMTREVAERISSWTAGASPACSALAGGTPAVHGRSGIGTTLAGNALGTAAIGATLREVATQDAYDVMLDGADKLVRALRGVIIQHALPWCVVHLGARAEIVFAPTPPQTAAAMRAALADTALNEALHLYLINRRILIAPFHMMMLVSPNTGADQIARLVAAVDDFAEEVLKSA